MNEYLKRNVGGTNKVDIERFKQYLRPGMELLSQRQKQVMKLYYVDNMTGVQIAAELGISQQGASKILNAAVKRMKRNITIMLHFQNKQPV